MKKLGGAGCRVHVDVCTNDRTAPRVSCSQVSGEDIFFALKEKVGRAGLVQTHWITRTGCLGFCNSTGTTVVVHAEGQPSRWYTEVTPLDLEDLWAEIVG